MCVRAEKDIAKGKEIHMIYGRKSNLAFFLNYGFIYKANIADVVPVTIGLDDN